MGMNVLGNVEERGEGRGGEGRGDSHMHLGPLLIGDEHFWPTF